MVDTAWVYFLRLEELVAYLEEFQFETTGSVEDLQRRLTSYIEKENHEVCTKKRLEELEEKFATTATRSPKLHETNQATTAGIRQLEVIEVDRLGDYPSTSSLQEQKGMKTDRLWKWDESKGFEDNLKSFVERVEELSTTQEQKSPIDRIRKWHVMFDGKDDPIAFIERVEDLAAAYTINLDALINMMSELLQGRALAWYRNNTGSWTTWKGFKKEFFNFFLPTKYFERLKDDMYMRVQKPGEKFKDFLLAIQTLMRLSEYPKERQLECIYSNMHPEYKFYAKRKDFSTLNELILLCDDYEYLLYTNTSSRLSCTRESDAIARLTPSVDTNKPMAEASVNVQESPSSPIRRTLRCEGTRIVALITLDGESREATIDTGAMHSFISEDLSIKLRRSDNVKFCKKRIRLAEGTLRHVSQSIEVNIQLGKRSCQLDIFIMPEVLSNLLLGLDFLARIGATLECGGEVLSLETDLHPIISEESDVNREPNEAKRQKIDTEPNAEKNSPVPVTWECGAGVPSTLPNDFIERINDAVKKRRRTRFIAQCGDDSYRVKISTTGYVVIFRRFENKGEVQVHNTTK